MKELTLEAAIENLSAVTAFVNEQMERLSCPIRVQNQVDIAIDELFSNIAHYAYYPETGPVTVQVETVENPPAVRITFLDHGVKFDPLAGEDPDVTRPMEERGIGGLGIYMVKKTMDEISYQYQNGQNILQIKKNFKSG